jgi:hypothetical protein
MLATSAEPSLDVLLCGLGLILIKGEIDDERI